MALESMLLDEFVTVHRRPDGTWELETRTNPDDPRQYTLQDAVHFARVTLQMVESDMAEWRGTEWEEDYLLELEETRDFLVAFIKAHAS